MSLAWPRRRLGIRLHCLDFFQGEESDSPELLEHHFDFIFVIGVVLVDIELVDDVSDILGSGLADSDHLVSVLDNLLQLLVANEGRLGLGVVGKDLVNGGVDLLYRKRNSKNQIWVLFGLLEHFLYKVFFHYIGWRN